MTDRSVKLRECPFGCPDTPIVHANETPLYAEATTEPSEAEVERVARALCARHIRHVRRFDTAPAELEAKLPAAVDHTWRDHAEDARAAIAALRGHTL